MIRVPWLGAVSISSSAPSTLGPGPNAFEAKMARRNVRRIEADAVVGDRQLQLSAVARQPNLDLASPGRASRRCTATPERSAAASAAPTRAASRSLGLAGERDRQPMIGAELLDQVLPAAATRPPASSSTVARP